MDATTAQRPSFICSETTLMLFCSSTGMIFRSIMPHLASPASGAGGSSGPPTPGRVKRMRLLGLGGPLGVVLDADLLHLVQALAPLRLLLVAAAPVRDLLPLGGGAVERLLGGLPPGEGLGDLEGELALVLIGGGDDRVGHHVGEAVLDGLEVLVGVGEGLLE